jgi:hypothetical protein
MPKPRPKNIYFLKTDPQALQAPQTERETIKDKPAMRHKLSSQQPKASAVTGRWQQFNLLHNL